MKLYTKFNTYLLENHPLLWHTRAIQLLAAALLFWLISFAIGYSSLRLVQLSNYEVTSHYTVTGFNLFHIASAIIIVAIWAIYFYKNNAFKSLYPLTRFYFQKMFVLLFIPFLLLSAAYLPFTKGAFLKTQSLLSQTELMKDYKVIQLADAFIPTNKDNYSIGKKSYPKPFPLKSIYYNRKTMKWSDAYLDIFVQASDSTDEKTVDYNYSPDNTTRIGGSLFQFYSSKDYWATKCSRLHAIDRIYVFDPEKDHLQLNSIWNFSGSHIIDYLTPMMNDSPYLSYADNYAPTVHKLATARDWKGIQMAIDKLKNVLQKYGIDHQLDTPQLVRYLEEKDFLQLEKICGQHRFSELRLEDVLRNRQMTITDYNNLSFVERFEFEPTQHIDRYALQKLYSNYNRTLRSLESPNGYAAYLFFALAFTLIVVYFQIIKPIPFLLSAPVWGILFIIIGIWFSFFKPRIFENDADIFIPFLFLLFLVQGTNLFLLFQAKGNKRILDITLCMALASSGFVLPVLLGFLHTSSKHRVYVACGDWNYAYFLDGLLVQPLVLCCAAGIGMLVSFSLARVWFGKSE